MVTGKVKWFNNEKGFGFITPKGSTTNVFVHVTELQKSGIDKSVDGQRVSFDIEKNNGKPIAVNFKSEE